MIEIKKRNDEEYSGTFHDIVSEHGTLERVYITSRNVDWIHNVPDVDGFFEFIFKFGVKYITMVLGKYSFSLSYDKWRKWHILSITKNEPFFTF